MSLSSVLCVYPSICLAIYLYVVIGRVGVYAGLHVESHEVGVSVCFSVAPYVCVYLHQQ